MKGAGGWEGVTFSSLGRAGSGELNVVAYVGQKSEVRVEVGATSHWYVLCQFICYYV